MVKLAAFTQSVSYPRPCALPWEDAEKVKDRLDFPGSYTHTDIAIIQGRVVGKAQREMQSSMELGKRSI